MNVNSILHSVHVHVFKKRHTGALIYMVLKVKSENKKVFAAVYRLSSLEYKTGDGGIKIPAFYVSERIRTDIVEI